jgi:hypothetical protein
MSTITLQDQVQLLDKIWKTYIVKMDQKVYSKFGRFLNWNITRTKKDPILSATDDAMNSKKEFHSIKDLLDDLNS